MGPELVSVVMDATGGNVEGRLSLMVMATNGYGQGVRFVCR
jgi:hypothetical protein